jgi:hypothetical protein
MGIVTPGNVAMGPGTLYVGDFGATEPAGDAVGIAQTPGVDFTDVGGTLGGLSIALNQDIKDLEFDQLNMAVGGRITKQEAIFSAKLAEMTLDNLVLAMNGGTLTSGSGYDAYDPDTGGSENEPDYKAIIFDGFGARGLRRRVILRKCLNTENLEVEATKDGQQVYAVKFKAYYVSSVIKPYRILQATSGS